MEARKSILDSKNFTLEELELIQSKLIHCNYMVPQAKSAAAMILFKKQNDFDLTESEETQFQEVLNFLELNQ